MSQLFCPYLCSVVTLTEERERHIEERHPDLLPEHRHLISETLNDPDQVRRSVRFASARMFSRWYPVLRGGKHVVVIVVSDADSAGRHWVITAYMARKLAEGVLEWTRS
jgi:hypothetical protein